MRHLSLFFCIFCITYTHTTQAQTAKNWGEAVISKEDISKLKEAGFSYIKTPDTAIGGDIGFYHIVYAEKDGTYGTYKTETVVLKQTDTSYVLNVEPDQKTDTDKPVHVYDITESLLGHGFTITMNNSLGKKYFVSYDWSNTKNTYVRIE